MKKDWNSFQNPFDDFINTINFAPLKWSYFSP